METIQVWRTRGKDLGLCSQYRGKKNTSKETENFIRGKGDHLKEG